MVTDNLVCHSIPEAKMLERDKITNCREMLLLKDLLILLIIVVMDRAGKIL